MVPIIVTVSLTTALFSGRFLLTHDSVCLQLQFFSIDADSFFFRLDSTETCFQFQFNNWGSIALMSYNINKQAVTSLFSAFFFFLFWIYTDAWINTRFKIIRCALLTSLFHHSIEAFREIVLAPGFSLTWWHGEWCGHHAWPSYFYSWVIGAPPTGFELSVSMWEMSRLTTMPVRHLDRSLVFLKTSSCLFWHRLMTRCFFFKYVKIC